MAKRAAWATVALFLALSLWGVLPDESGQRNICKYICDQGVCPPCPGQEPPPPMTPRPVFVRDTTPTPTPVTAHTLRPPPRDPAPF